MINRLILITVCTALAVVPAAAVPATPLQVDTTYSTGYNGTEITPGQPDAFFNLYSFDVTLGSDNPVVANPIAGPWYHPTGGVVAQWISPTEDQTYPSNGIGDPPGTYDYDAQLSTDFTVASNVATSVTLTGSFAADNDVTLDVDGSIVMSLNAPAYTTLTPFTYTFNIYGGKRSTSIDFVVNNLDDTGGSNNPTGLIVSNLRISAPEPSTWVLMFAGLGSLLMVKRIRRVVAL
jgi:hypothetical protein